MAIISTVRSVRWCAVVPGTERYRVSRKYCLWPQQFFKNHHQNYHVCLFYESIETGWIETVCFTYIPKLNPVSDSKPKPVSTNDHALSVDVRLQHRPPRITESCLSQPAWMTTPKRRGQNLMECSGKSEAEV